MHRFAGWLRINSCPSAGLDLLGATFSREWPHGCTRLFYGGIGVAVSCEHPSELLSDVHAGEVFGPGRVLPQSSRPLG